MSTNIYRDSMRAAEREMLTTALRCHNGNVTHTARALGMPLRTLQHRLHLLGLTKPQTHAPDAPAVTPDVPHE